MKDMLESLLEFTQDMTNALKNAQRTISEAANDFLIALLEFLRDARIWLSEVAVEIREYLTTLFSYLFDLGISLVKVSLFYIPSIATLIIYAAGNSILWIVFASLWFILVQRQL
ncbi:hypothetical protein POG22_11450 [Geitlerinema sp. CS-897]|nr:hypothetical protein [Geitlerinema sp. CS-897]